MMRFFSVKFGVGWLPLLFLLGLLAPRAARASHALGGDLSYVSIAPGMYLVQFRFYRDCSGIPAPSGFTLEYSATGCGPSGAAWNPGGTQTLLPRFYQTGNPYCHQQNQLSLCDSANSNQSNGYPNYQIYTYGGIVSLGTGPASECSEWVFSTSLNARPNVANLSTSTDLYTYALLNTRDVSVDSSPAFSVAGGLQPLAVMYDTTLVRYNCGVIDPDGDSLVYSMAPALSGANTPIPYTVPYTFLQPVRLKPGSPPLRLDQQGTLEFTPGLAVPGSMNDEDNKFVVAIQVDAYRRVNGQVIRTGRARREIAAVIARGNGYNAPPALSRPDSIPLTNGAGLQFINYGDTVWAYTGEPLQLDVPLVDVNGDSVFVEMPVAQSPAGSTLLASRYVQVPGVATFLTARINWTPTAADVRSQAHTFYLRVRDNGCPNAASAFYPLSVMIAALRPVGIVGNTAPRSALRAAPNPFSSATQLSVPVAAAPAALGIYDLTGRLVDYLTVPPATATLTWHTPARLPAGVYVARYGGATGSRSVRLVKQ